MIVRPARSTDAGAVGGILSEFIDTTDWMPRIHTRAEDLSFAGMMIARGWVSVVEDKGVVGFAACDGPDLNALYVAGHARGRGIGSALLSTLKESRRTLELWTFQRNTQAQKFYMRHGFVEVARTEGARNDERLPDIRYVWKKEGL
ncbi:GNAT family N-acetyltransferase [uncultured Sulfitobacter sp.]|uniref:GNAT family N-acetyltransferase n=1 Tax=uncultured Sulfitobacter sp. TaxID=191468 RepID=UPI00261DED82|nr:GNAT family N-acetyltransferase [uncultured Sulfitobacter sp.]